MSDHDENVLTVFNSDAKTLRKWGSEGSGPDQLDGPCFMDMDAKGFIYVADCRNDRIQIFSAEGKPVARWSGSGVAGDRPFRGPVGVTCDPRNELVYVSDTDNGRVQVFSCAGQFVRTIGQGILRWPCNCAVDADDGLLFVADRGNYRICVFAASDGKLVREWELRGSVANVIIHSDLVYVATSDGRIQVFTKQGEFQFSWGGVESGDSFVRAPRGMQVIGEQLYICGRDSLQVFS